MDDLNFLHGTYNNHQSDITAKKSDDELEEFGLNPKLIVVEDDKILGLSIKKYLMKTLNCEVELFTNSIDCLTHLLNLPNPKAPFCLITDISLEYGTDGLLLIDNLKEKGFNFVSIAMTGFASIETAIAATKKGVYHYLTKPFELEILQKLIMEAISKKLGITVQLIDRSKSSLVNKENKILSEYKIEEPNEDDFFYGMLGRSQIMRDVFERIKKVALTDSTILITGCSGTGKELVASSIHNLSSRKEENKVSVNCGAIPRDLLESELFGHVKGSFTGAISDRKGRFEMANKGTIFLDEIGDMPHLLQVKLLRVLQNKTIEPVGSNATVDIDTRIITATHRDLEKMVEESTFREDLFYRLNVIPIRVPTLKERREDIPLLISYFVNRYVSADRSNLITFSSE
ncbi:MAG: sigma-54-dependent Fis family transcriptional regulator, partial [Halobacteriovoraceae bacterium]|nr:sigma-54-dependent Fis family transcriptional regulator [Halobacteriovoraceae bacterium]